MIEECIGCAAHDDIDREDTFLKPFAGAYYICELCAEKRGV